MAEVGLDGFRAFREGWSRSGGLTVAIEVAVATAAASTATAFPAAGFWCGF